MPGAVLVVVCHHHFQSYLLSQLEYILHFFILGSFQSSGDERAGIRAGIRAGNTRGAPDNLTKYLLNACRVLESQNPTTEANRYSMFQLKIMLFKSVKNQDLKFV